MLRYYFSAILFALMWGSAAAQTPSGMTTTAIPSSILIQPEVLASELKTEAKPVLLQVGYKVLFEQAHIPGSIYAGPADKDEGIENLKSQVRDIPKDKPVVVYCGCCPWLKCPNVAVAWHTLTTLGFTHVQVLYLEKNLGANWVDKGYPVVHG